MSFILDAIAKSEQERQQLEVPSAEILAVPVANNQPRHRLPYYLVGAFLLNAIVLAIWLRSDDPLASRALEETDRVEQSSIILDGEPGSTLLGQQQSRTSGLVNANTSSEIVGKNEITTDISTANDDVKSNEEINTRSEKALPETDEETKGWIRIEPDSLLKNTERGLGDESGEPKNSQTDSKPPTVSRFYDLPKAVRDDVPTVKFSGHLYSSDPASSVVFLDNQRPVMQGQQIANDLFLHEITPSGVIVEFRGYLIEVGVLQNWTLN